MLRGSFSTGEAAKGLYGSPMSVAHFELFTTILLDKIQAKIQNNALPSNLEPKNIRENEALQEQIWQGIDIGAIYDATESLLANELQLIKEKSEELSNRGHPEAAKAAANLHNDLQKQRTDLISEKISVTEFGQQCHQLINAAQQGELKNHRGFLNNIWHGIKVALNYLTAGAVSVTPTKSIEKTVAMKKALTDFLESTETKPDAPKEPDKPRNKSPR
ncbi:MAG: hypothetical protein ACHP65_00545 [Legionellales bacterium]